MKEMVLLEYSFMFEAGSPWTHLSDFETDLAEFFQAQGLEAEIVKTVKGQWGRVLVIRKKETALKKLDEIEQKGVQERLKSVGKELKLKKEKRK